MRRSDREIKEFAKIVDVLDRCDTIRLGLWGDEFPYVVPLSFGYEVAQGKIVVYIHGAKEGLKHDLIAKNNKICVEADLCHRFTEIENHDVTTEYESVIGFGTAEKADEAETLKGLDLILAHCGFPNYPYNKAATAVLTVYKITLDHVTGKRRTV